MFVFQACYGTMSSAEIDIVEDIVDSMDEVMDEEDEVETLEVTSTLKASDSLACDE